MIYFIKCHSTVKIGYSGIDDIHIRLYALQVSSPFKLEVMKTINGSRILEKAFHKVFKPYRIRGEWYELNEKLVQYINGTPSGKESISDLELERKASRKTAPFKIPGLCESCGSLLSIGRPSKKYCNPYCRRNDWGRKNPHLKKETK